MTYTEHGRDEEEDAARDAELDEAMIKTKWIITSAGAALMGIAVGLDPLEYPGLYSIAAVILICGLLAPSR